MIVNKFYRSWSWLAATVGLVLPELLQVLADNTSLIPHVEPSTQGTIRLVALLLVVVLRPIRQANMD